MAMGIKHTPVRIEESIYSDIKDMSESLGISTKKLVELLLTKSLEDLRKKDSISLTISKKNSATKVALK